MADPAEQVQKVNLREHWLKQFARLVEYAKRDWQAQKLEQQPMWFHPEAYDWNKDLFDLKGMASPFDRKEHAEDFEKIVKDTSSPGCAGDFMATQLQGDWLACLERAYRERHKTWPRMMVHANCRRYGHQHDLGVFQLGQKDYLQFILRHTGSDKPAG